jgi:uncharacterized protein YcbX
MQANSPHPADADGGSVGALWRYPVKSMLGEELNAAEITPGGLLGDRQFAVVGRGDREGRWRKESA